MIGTFQEMLKGVAYTHMKQQDDPRWYQLSKEITQEVLNDAASKFPVVEETLRGFVYGKGSGGIIVARCPKRLERIQQKMAETEKRDGAYFRVVSDLIAFRVPCEVAQIQETCDRIRHGFETLRNGAVFVKGSHRNDKDASNPFVDIVQYIYAYDPNVSFITEVQVGHPLAAYTFSVDSALRDDPNCKRVDLWKDGVYQKLRQRILETANARIRGDDMAKVSFTTSKYDLYDAVWTLHSGEPPRELRDIVDSIFSSKQ